MVDEKEQELMNHHDKELMSLFMLLISSWKESGREGERWRTKYYNRNYEADKSGVSPFGLSNLINTLFISISFSSTYMHVQPCSCGWKVSCKIHRWIVASCPYKVGCM